MMVWDGVVRCCTVWGGVILWYGMALYCVMVRCGGWYGMALCGMTLWYGMVWYDMMCCCGMVVWYGVEVWPGMVRQHGKCDAFCSNAKSDPLKSPPPCRRPPRALHVNGRQWTSMDVNGAVNGAVNGRQWTSMDVNGRQWTSIDVNGR